MSQDPTDGPDPERLKRLEERLTEVRRTHEPAPRVDDQYSQANMAWRMVIELVSGLGIGFGIGYGLDVLFGTLPLLMVLFTFLGLAAGVRVMLRTARELGEERQAADAADEEGR
jgi:ATP synthase protein I